MIRNKKEAILTSVKGPFSVILFLFKIKIYLLHFLVQIQLIKKIHPPFRRKIRDTKS